MNRALLRVLRTVIRTDSDPARQALFRAMVQDRPTARLAFTLHEAIAGSLASAALVSLYGAASLILTGPAANRSSRVLAFARHANARRQVANVMSWLGESECGIVRSGRAAMVHPDGAVALLRALTSGRLGQVLRILRRVDGRHGFLVSCRVAGAIGWYSRSHDILARHNPSAVLVSSDAQPEEMAFVAAARARAIPQVFASHAYPTPLSPPLDFSLSILEGQAELEARMHAGPTSGAVVLAGIEGESSPMDVSRLARPHPVVGIFTPKAITWSLLQQTLEECFSCFQARQVIIRWHPSMVERPHLHQMSVDRSRIVESPGSSSLVDIARQCDWVIADENSHVHLPVLKLGIPTVTVRLGVYPESRADQYGFIAHGIVPPRVKSLAEMNPDGMADFFSDCWASRFGRYDAAYLRPRRVVEDEVRGAVWKLFEASRPPVMTR